MLIKGSVPFNWFAFKPPRFFILTSILTAVAGSMILLYNHLFLNGAKLAEVQKFLDLPMLLIGFSLSIMTESMTIILLSRRRDIWKTLILCNIYSYILLALIYPFLVLSPSYNQDDVTREQRTMSGYQVSPGGL